MVSERCRNLCKLRSQLLLAKLDRHLLVECIVSAAYSQIGACTPRPDSRTLQPRSHTQTLETHLYLVELEISESVRVVCNVGLILHDDLAK